MSGKSLIGIRIAILWNPTMTWYSGTCMAYNATTKLYFIKYDSTDAKKEEETEWVDLDHHNTKESVICWNIEQKNNINNFSPQKMNSIKSDSSSSTSNTKTTSIKSTSSSSSANQSTTKSSSHNKSTINSTKTSISYKTSTTRTQPMPLKYCSLFSGIGGFELGITRALPNSICMGFSEVCKESIEIYQRHFPTHKNMGDVTKIFWNIKTQGKVDLLVGGSPCQNLTTANNLGDGSGLKGQKSGLFYHYCRLFKEMGCQYFLLENVSRMKKDDLNGITTTLQTLTRLPVRRYLMNSADFSGQRRRRFFWTNVPLRSTIFETLTPPPTVEEILLPMEDCLSLEVTEAAKLYMNRQVADGRHKWQFGFHSDMKNGKSSTVTAAWHKGTPYNCFIDRRYTSTYGLEHKKEIFHFNEKKKKEQNLKLIKKNKGTIIRSIRAGKQLIGTRLVILWNPTMTWFNGTCMAYNATTHLYYIKYDSAADATNEETEWLDLDHVNKKDSSITWHIASTPKTKIQKATRKSKRQTSSTSSSKVSSASSSSTSSSSFSGDGEGFCVGSQVRLCNTNYCGIIKDMLQKDELHVHVEWSDSKHTKVLTTNIEFNHTSTSSSSSNTVRTFDLIRNGLTGQGMIRYLHPIEVERLQTFPDNWTKDLPKTHRFKMLGNAVTVSVVEYICTNLDFSGNGDGGGGGSSSSGSGGGKNDVKVEISNKQNIVNDKSSGSNSSSSSSNKMEVRKVPLYMNEDDVKGIKSNRWGTGGTHISKKRKVVESDVVTGSKKKK